MSSLPEEPERWEAPMVNRRPPPGWQPKRGRAERIVDWLDRQEMRFRAALKRLLRIG